MAADLGEARVTWRCFRTPAALLALSLALIAAPALIFPGQSAASDRITIQPGFNDAVLSISEPDRNGTRYLGGLFTAVDAWRTGAGARTAASSGAVDRSFPSIFGSIRSYAPDGSGGYFVGGRFDCVGPDLNGGCDGPNDVVRNNAAHIRADGSLSPWNPDVRSAEDQNGVTSLAVSGNTVYLGGGFSSVGGQPRSNAAAVESTGNGALLGWNPGPENTVWSLAVSGGAVYLGGEFTSVGGEARSQAAAVGTDGTLLPWNPNVVTTSIFAPGVRDLAVSGDTVYLAGVFNTVGGEPRSNAAAVASDGTGALRSWNPDPNSWVESIEVAGDTVYLGGLFTSVAGQLRNYVAAVGTDGALVDWDPNPDDWVFSVEPSGNTVYLGGQFGTIAGEVRNQAAAVGTDGSLKGWDPNPAGAVFTIEASGDTVTLGGSFNALGGRPRNNAAAIRADGTLAAWNPAPNVAVEAVEVSGDTVYLGGSFTSVAGQPRNYAAAVGTDGTLKSWNPNADQSILAIRASGDTVYLGGTFTSIMGQPRSSAAAVGTDGTLLPWDPDLASTSFFGSTVRDLAVSGDTVYLGGSFTSAAGQPRNYAAAVGTDGVLRAWNPSLDDFVQTLEVSGDTVYLGGGFTEAGGQPRNQIAAFGTDGTLLPWNPILEQAGFLGLNIQDIAVAGNTVYLGGALSTVNGERRDNVAAVEAGGTGALLPWSPSLNGPAWTIQATRDTVYLGGFFTEVNSRNRNSSAAIGADGTLLDPWPSSGPLPAPVLGKPAIKGPAKAKRGRTTTFRVTVRNAGRATATGVKVTARGKGVSGSKSVGQIAAGRSKTVSLPLRFKSPGKVKVSFKVTATNAASKTTAKTVTVTR